MHNVELIQTGGEILAYVIRAGWNAVNTTFITPASAEMQVGVVVYPAGGEVRAHTHVPIREEITSRTEVLLVREGRCQIDLFDTARRAVCSRVLEKGDAMVLVAGYHGVKMLDLTSLFEVKQGPYAGPAEKEFL